MLTWRKNENEPLFSKFKSKGKMRKRIHPISILFNRKRLGNLHQKHSVFLKEIQTLKWNTPLKRNHKKLFREKWMVKALAPRSDRESIHNSFVCLFHFSLHFAHSRRILVPHTVPGLASQVRVPPQNAIDPWNFNDAALFFSSAICKSRVVDLIDMHPTQSVKIKRPWSEQQLCWPRLIANQEREWNCPSEYFSLTSPWFLFSWVVSRVCRGSASHRRRKTNHYG